MDIVTTPTAYLIRKGSEFVRYPRVTEIIKIAGLSNFEHVDIGHLERNARFGKSVHLACKYWDEGILNKYKIDPLILPYLEGWKKFRAEITWAKPNPTSIEQTGWSTIWGYAGTPDRVWGPNLADIKTAKTINKKECELQTIAYAKLSKGIKKRWIVQLGEGIYKLIPCDSPLAWGVFTSCLTVYKYKLRKE